MQFEMQHIAFDLKKRLFRRAEFRLIRSIENNERQSISQVESDNLAARLELARFAFRHVPIYRAKYAKCGVAAAEDLETEADFERLPVITKDDLRNHNDDFWVEKLDRSIGRESTTGGSTGAPVRVYHDRRFNEGVFKWRLFRWWGLPPDASQACVWRALAAPPTIRRRPTLCRAVPAPFLDASNISEASIDTFIAQCNARRPIVLKGYVGAIEHLARHIESHKIFIRPFSLVWVTSAPVSVAQRRLMERAFHAPVADQYGCCEIYWLAAECPQSHGGLHAFEDMRHIEFLDEKGARVPHGEDGRIVLTDLCNRAFPLIRYENGDRGRWIKSRQCGCGRSLPLMDSVKGRETDSFVLPNGTCMAGDVMTTLFDDCPDAVCQFQVVYKPNALLTLRVSPNRNHPDSARQIQSVLRRLEHLTLKSVPIALDMVDHIPHDRGKTRYVVIDQ